MKNNPTNENFEKKKIEKIPKTFGNKFFFLTSVQTRYAALVASCS